MIPPLLTLAFHSTAHVIWMSLSHTVVTNCDHISNHDNRRDLCMELGVQIGIAILFLLIITVTLYSCIWYDSRKPAGMEKLKDMENIV
jgi:hypothetical protein